MCNRVLLLFGKLLQWNLHVNCHVNGTTFQSGLRFQTGLSSLRVSCCKTHFGLQFYFGQFDRSEFRSGRSRVNADNEVTSHQSEILSRSEISNRFESLRVSCKRAPKISAENMNDYVMRILIRSVSHTFLQIKDCSLKI